jgi:hypothetical protein
MPYREGDFLGISGVAGGCWFVAVEPFVGGEPVAELEPFDGPHPQPAVQRFGSQLPEQLRWMSVPPIQPSEN